MTSLRAALSLIAAVIAGLACAGPASAATVSESVLDPGQSSQFVTAQVTGTGQDADDVTVAWADGTLTVTDATAPMVPGAGGCEAVDAHTARCGGVGGVGVDGGEGDDRITVVAPTTHGVGLTGGAGDDVLTGGPGRDSFDGGPGADTIVGGGGGDEAYVDLGPDLPGLAGDRIDLRGGDSSLKVVTHTPDAALDLRAGTLKAGAATVPVLGVRDANLGPVAGTLLGDDSDNRLQGAGLVDGRGGYDTVQGMPGTTDRLLGDDGDDSVQAGPGDTADGGPGKDKLSAPEASSGKPAKLACGAGDSDEVLPGNLALVPLDCEWTFPDPALELGTPRRTRSGVTIPAWFTPGRRQCGVLAEARSTSGRAYGPRVQVKLRETSRHATLRLPVPRGARTLRLALSFEISCPAHRPWGMVSRRTTYLALPAR